MMKNIIVEFGFQLRKNNNKIDVRVVILIITLIYVIIAIRKVVICRANLNIGLLFSCNILKYKRVNVIICSTLHIIGIIWKI